MGWEWWRGVLDAEGRGKKKKGVVDRRRIRSLQLQRALLPERIESLLSAFSITNPTLIYYFYLYVTRNKIFTSYASFFISKYLYFYINKL